ncbi:MAG: hypothetical protein U1E65_25825 [Myxococcota bacterium]
MRRLLALAFVPLLACQDKGSGAAPSGGGGGHASTATAAFALAKPTPGSRYEKIAGLLELDPQALTRAKELYVLVAPVCTDPTEQKAFIAEVIRLGTLPEDPERQSQRRSFEITEHVVNACARNDAEAALTILNAIGAAIPKNARLSLMQARVLAAAERLPEAKQAAEAARDAGSIGALALLATIDAQIARSSAVGYRPGMLDEALKTVSLEPDGQWPLLDLTAVLTTRARLLTERAAWESGEAQEKTLKEARVVYERLAVSPFIEVTRTHALDVLCFDAASLSDKGGPFLPCKRAAEEASNLGGAFLIGAGLDPAHYDVERVKRIQELEAAIATMPDKAAVILTVRGDESELIPWVRPAALVVARAAERRGQLVVLDRTSGPRAGAIVDRIVSLSGQKPYLRLEADHDILAMPCLAALVAGRKAPESCPFDAASQEKLMKLKTFGVAILVGRDLDAEIEDLRLYELPDLLMSFRMPATEKGIKVQLKNLSDAWILASGADKRAGSLPKR